MDFYFQLTQNITVSVKDVVNEIIVPYVTEKGIFLGLKEDFLALFVMDVFREQMKEDMPDLLKNDSIVLVKYSTIMTQLLKPLDLTVDGLFKNHTKNKFSKWYSKEALKQPEQGVSLEQVENDLKLTDMKSLHDIWLTSFTIDCQHQKVKKLRLLTGYVLVFLTPSLWGVIDYHRWTPLGKSTTKVELKHHRTTSRY